MVTLSREPGKGTPQPRCLTGAGEAGVQLEISRSSRTQRSPTPEPAAQDGEKTKVASTIAQPVPPAQQPPAPQVTTTSKSRAPAVVHVDLSPSPEREEFDFEKEIRRRDAAIAQQSAMQGDRAAPVAKRCPCTPCKPGVPVPPPAKQSASKCDQRQLGTALPAAALHTGSEADPPAAPQPKAHAAAKPKPPEGRPRLGVLFPQRAAAERAAIDPVHAAAAVPLASIVATLPSEGPPAAAAATASPARHPTEPTAVAFAAPRRPPKAPAASAAPMHRAPQTPPKASAKRHRSVPEEREMSTRTADVSPHPGPQIITRSGEKWVVTPSSPNVPTVAMELVRRPARFVCELLSGVPGKGVRGAAHLGQQCPAFWKGLPRPA